MRFFCCILLLVSAGISVFAEGFVPRAAIINGMRDNKNSSVFCDLLFAELLKNNKLELVEREIVDKVFQEQDISDSSNSGTLVKTGNLLRADMLIILVSEGDKAKVYFFDVNHGLRVAVCGVDVANHSKSLKSVNESLKKALAFVGGKGKPIYLVPPFSNSDILYQNDKYQGLLAEELRNELFSKGALLIEFDEALRIVGELNISEGDGEIKPLPLTLVSGEFTQNPKDKNSIDLNLSKIQLNNNTASLFSGKINVKNQAELKSAIRKIAALLLRKNKTPVALDLKKQLSIMLKKANEHMNAEAYEQARIEAATAIMMDTSNVEPRMIFCLSIAENLKTNKYRQADPKYFQKLCLQFLDQLEWLAMNGKAGHKIPYFDIIKAAKERLDDDSFLNFMLALQDIAARGMTRDYALCSLYAQALKAQFRVLNCVAPVSRKAKAERLAGVVIANKVYKKAFSMIEETLGGCRPDDEPVYAVFYYILLQQKDMPYSQRKLLSAALEKLNESKKKKDGGILYQIPQIKAPVDNLNKYLKEPEAFSGSETAAAEALESLKLVEDYNGIRLKLESIRKSGKELDNEQNGKLGEAYGKMLYEILVANADLAERRKLYLRYSELCISLLEETYKKRQMEPEIAVLNDKGFQELVFSDPKDEALIAAYGKMIDSVRCLTEDILKTIARMRAEKRCFTNDEKYLLTYEYRLWKIYFNSFAELPPGELAKSFDRIDSPGTPLWTEAIRASLSYLLFNRYEKPGRNLMEFLAGSDKYKDASKPLLALLAEDFKKYDPSTLSEDIRAILALLPPPAAEPEKKINVNEVQIAFPKGCESLRKEVLRDLILCGKNGEAMLYDCQILFSPSPGKLEKLIRNTDNVECVSDAAWDGKYLWYAVINKNESERKGCSRGEIICWDPATGKKKKWDSKKGVALEFLKESEKWKAERKKDLGFRHLVTRGAYSVIQIFPCEGKVFVFTTFYDPLDFKSSYIGRRVWIGVIENTKDLKIFYREKVGDNSPFFSKIKFTGKPVSCRDKILRYYGNRMTMSIDTSSLKVSFKEYKTIGWILFDSERCRTIDDYVFFDNDGLWAAVTAPDELSMKFKFGSGESFSLQPLRNNFFKYGNALYLQVAGDGVYHIMAPQEKPDLVIDYKTFQPAFDDLLISSHYGILGIKDGKFYSVILP